MKIMTGTKKELYQSEVLTKHNVLLGDTWCEVYKFMYRNRDSKVLANCNFDEAFRLLTVTWTKLEQQEEYKYRDRPFGIQSFRCSFYGWYENILIDLDAPEEIIKKAEHIVDCIMNYPVLNDDLYSKALYQNAIERWNESSHWYKVEVLKDELDMDARAARRITPPREYIDWINRNE